MIGNQIAKIFPIISLAPACSQHARTTRTLQPIPLSTAGMNGIEVLEAAIAIALSPAASANSPLLARTNASSTDPIRLPMYTITQFLSILPAVIFLSIRARVRRLLPVKSSAPHRMTIIRPTGNRAAPISLATMLWNGSPPAAVASTNTFAPNPIYAPASIPRTSILPTDRFAFLIPLLIHISVISAGELTPIINFLFSLIEYDLQRASSSVIIAC